MKYYINGEQVAFTTANVFFERCKMAKGYTAEYFSKLKISEEGREVIGEITDCQLEVIAE